LKRNHFLIMAARTKKTPPPVSEEALIMIASWFRTLAEPSRLKILRALEEGEKNITELVTATGLTQANVSRHVQSLVDAGMVGRRREGLTAICFISDPSITDLCDNVCNNLMKRLSHQVKKLGGSAK
jgi:ArsR family transcriptional regulator